MKIYYLLLLGWLCCNTSNANTMAHQKPSDLVRTTAAPASIQLKSPIQVTCNTNTLQVDYLVSGAFNTGNKFILQLSDAKGVFANVPTTLASIVSSKSGSLKTSIPAIKGNTYNLRIVSTNPVVTSDVGKLILQPSAPSIAMQSLSSTTVAKVWDKSFGSDNNDVLMSMITTNDGGFLLGGHSNGGISANKSEASRGRYDYWIVKTDANGKKLWDKTFGGKSDENLSKIIPSKDGGYLLVGTTYSTGIGGDKTTSTKGFFDYWIVKIDANGKKRWDTTFGGTAENTLSTALATADGGYLLGGYSTSGIGGDKSEATKGSNDYWVIKIDANGKKLWDKTLGSNGDDYLIDLATTTDGGFLLAGMSRAGISGDKTSAAKGYSDYWLVKIDANGKKAWDKTYGGYQDDFFNDLEPCSDGGFLLGGSSYSGIGADKSESTKGGQDYWVLKIDATGKKLWDKTYGGSSDDILANITSTNAGFLLYGSSLSPSSADKSEALKGDADYWCINIGNTGNKIWDKSLGSVGYNNATQAIYTSDGSYVLGGYTNADIGADKSTAHIGYNDFWLVKIKASESYYNQLTATGCSGNIVWSNGATANPLLINPSSATAFTATCTINGCKSEVSNSLVVPSLFKPTAPSIKADNTTICAGSNVTLTASGCSGGVVSWTGKKTGNSLSVSLSTTQTFKAVCTLNGIASDSSNAISIQVIAKPNAPTITSQKDSTTTITTQWQQYINSNGSSTLVTMLPTPEGGYLLGGDKSQTSKGKDFWVIKTDKDGKKSWDKTFGGDKDDILTSMTSTKDGGFLLAGYSYSGIGGDKSQANKGNAAYWIIKIDATGKKLWDKTFGGISTNNNTSANNFLSSVASTTDGGFLLGGSSDASINGDKTQATKGFSDYWIIRIDGNGNKLWDKTFGGNTDEQLSTIVAISDGNFLLAGSSNAGINNDKTEASRGYFDYWLVKINSTGQLLWNKTLGGDGRDMVTCAIATPDGGYVIGGNSNSNKSGDKTQGPSNAKSDNDYWIVKLDAIGNKLWDKNFGGFDPDNLFSLVATKDGGFLLGGSSYGMGSKDFWLIKTDKTGQKMWDKYLDSDSDDESLRVITFSQDGSYILGSNKSDNNFTLFKLQENTNITYTLTATGCNGTVKWSNGTTGSTLKIASTSSGNYTATCAANGCNSDASKTISLITKTETPFIQVSNGYVCAGTSVTLTALGCDAGELSWTGGLKGRSLVITPKKTQTYRVVCIKNGIPSDSSTAVSIVVASQPSSPTVVVQKDYVATQWNKTIGGNSTDIHSNVITTKDGGFLAGGTSLSAISADKTVSLKGNSDYWITKMDATGKKLWDKAFGSKGSNTFTSLVGTPDGGFLLGGYTDAGIGGDKSEVSKGGNDYWVVKIDANGKKTWDKTFGGNSQDYLRQALATTDGGFLLVGTSSSGISGHKSENLKGTEDFWIVKIDNNGKKLWDKSFGAKGNDLFNTFTCALATADGGYLLGGYTTGVGGDKSDPTKGGSDYWIIKIDANGKKLWDKTFGGNNNEKLACIISTADKNYLLAGSSDSNISGDKSNVAKGKNDFWIVKMDVNGKKIWDKTYGGSDNDNLVKVILKKDGGFILGGSSASDLSGDKTERRKSNRTERSEDLIGIQKFDYWLVSTDANGTKLWDKTLGSYRNDELSDLLLTTDGGYLVTGTSNSDANQDKAENAKGSEDFWIIKLQETNATTLIATNCAGVVTWNNTSTGSMINVNPNTTTNYTAICTVNNCMRSNPSSTTVKVNNNTSLAQARIEALPTAVESPVTCLVFPNPTTDYLTVTSTYQGIATFLLFDLQGNLILEQSFENQTFINLSQHSKGIYLYTIYYNEGKYVGKIILQ